MKPHHVGGGAVITLAGLGAFLVPGSPEPVGAAIFLGVFAIAGLAVVLFGGEGSGTIIYDHIRSDE